MGKYIIALDQGTTSSRSIAFDRNAEPVGQCSQEYRQIYPKPGWVEHDPEDIWTSQIESFRQLLREREIASSDIEAIGITNQRETIVVWDKRTGIPVYNAIVWQCRRTADYCDELIRQGHDRMIREKTGLIVDAYFSATKLRWLLKNVEGLRERAEKGEVLAGTVDTWLIWRMTAGKIHVTDVTNAARTMMYNIHARKWDDELLALYDIPKSILPEVRDTSCVYGNTDPDIMGFSVPIASAVGDQHAALFGQACFTPGCVKNTYGTGCFALMNTGDIPVGAKGLLTTVAWSIGGKTTYALEGSIFIGGAVIQWLRDELGLISSADEVNYWAGQVPDAQGVYIVPAFVGLGTPHWDMYARGTIVGLTRGSGRAHICRAALDSIAYQVRDVIALMRDSAGVDIPSLHVDGGASVSQPLMQFQADILGTAVERPQNIQTTALGAAYLAGLATGFWSSVKEIEDIWRCDARFVPDMEDEKREKLLHDWNRAVERAKHWAEA